MTQGYWQALIGGFSVICVTILGPVALAGGDGVFTCVLSNGQDVPILADTNLQNVAVARRNREGQRTIVYNPTYMEPFQPATRWFWLAHECAHQQLGHTLGHFDANREQEADCYGVRQLIKNDEIDLEGLNAIENDIKKIGGDGKAYLPGPQRAANIEACALTKP